MNMHVGGAQKFKVGDLVTVAEDYEDLIAGKRYTIKDEAARTDYRWWNLVGVRNKFTSDGSYPEYKLIAAQKFAAGDKVRALESCYGGGYKKGNVYTVKSVSDEYDHLTTELDDKGSRTNGWRKSAFEPYTAPTYSSCAAAEVDNLADEYGGVRKVAASEPGYRFTNSDRPEPGDRVSIGGQGTFTVKDVLADGNVRFTDRPRDLFWQLHDSASSSDCTLVQAAPTLRIEAGKFYKTRDGRKVGPMVWRDEDTSYPWVADFKNDTSDPYRLIFTDAGKNYMLRHLDLIAEWQDAPVVAEAKFKVGDKVGCTTNRSTNYVVKALDGDKVSVAGLREDGSEIHTFRGQDASIFYLLPQAVTAPAPTTIADIVRKHSSEGTAIVALIENGQPKPSTVPYVHADRAFATTEAGRLAGIHKGQEFGVYELVSVAKVEKVYDHEWQRLAAGGQVIAAIKELRSNTGLYLKTAKDAVEDWLRREAA
ncbi:MAG: hypothetical protein E5Y73_17230 [Mesorhizobium sp.]|uniref:hypothetical protein n=1 Tax=Mesorhizobium sp. TaxID=1871066 RepID=UPI00120467A2|nr:hypothetical protein [Mesorhizobium sp.]TIL91420.1 MAG: hypothetical protein E5Y73_17230 [Mesorhizobium sp.]